MTRIFDAGFSLTIKRPRPSHKSGSSFAELVTTVTWQPWLASRVANAPAIRSAPPGKGGYAGVTNRICNIALYKWRKTVS